MLNFALLENNKKLLENLSHMLESIFMQHNFDAQICIKTIDPNDLLEYTKNNRIDVLLLDIELNKYLDGFQIVDKVRKINKNCYIIFETAHFEYSLMAYRYKTFDFLCKPISIERLKDTIIRLFEDVSKVSKNFIKLDNKNTIIAESEIEFIQKDGMKLIFHTNSKDYAIYSSFSKIQKNLPNNFIRCHKSFIANISNITKVEASENCIFFNDSFCDIGPKYKKDFMEAVKFYGNIN